MSAPRRRAVITGAAAVAATGPMTTATASSAQAAKQQTDLLRRSRFTPHVGSTFTSTSAAGRWSVVLVSVADLGPGGVAGGEKQFAVSFTGTLPGDGVYTFARKGFTATPLFVVAARGRPLAVVNCL